jgi:superoxide dismutase, Cu-Zn family
MKTFGFAAALLLATAIGCGDKDKDKTTDEPPATDEPATTTPEPKEPAAPVARTAVAELQSAEGHEVSGTVTFTETGDGKVEVAVQVDGLTPGEHGFHIHETGDCSAADFTSAGGHFDPRGHKHGAPGAEEHHAGDFGNLLADDQGKATMKTTVDYINLTEGEAPVVGKAVIVHDKKDDLTTQPTGDAGGRVACGIIELTSAPGAQPTGATDPAGGVAPVGE